MQFDPAFAARQALIRARESRELGVELGAAIDAEARFSSGVGEEASAAYRELVKIAARHPEDTHFTEFLVYATWCHLMDETVPEHFKRGVALCRQLLQQDLSDTERITRLRSIERSFRAGLGEKSEDPMGYDQDTLEGGD